MKGRLCNGKRGTDFCYQFHTRSWAPLTASVERNISPRITQPKRIADYTSPSMTYIKNMESLTFHIALSFILHNTLIVPPPPSPSMI